MDLDKYQSLRCEKCGETWLRAPTRGRVPKTCPKCKAASVDQIAARPAVYLPAVRSTLVETFAKPVAYRPSLALPSVRTGADLSTNYPLGTHYRITWALGLMLGPLYFDKGEALAAARKMQATQLPVSEGGDLYQIATITISGLDS